MRQRGPDEEGGGDPGEQPDEQRPGASRADEGGEDLEIAERRDEQIHHRPLQLHDEERGQGVEEAVVDDAEHDQARYQEAAVGDAVHLAQAAAQRIAENDEVERRGDERRQDRLSRDAQEPLHFLAIEGADAEGALDDFSSG